MSYIFKKSFRLKAGQKEYQYSLGKDELPSFMGGMFGKSQEISGLNEFINIINESEDARHFSFYALPQEDLDIILKDFKKKIVSFKYCEIKEENKILDFRYLKLCKKLVSVEIAYHNKYVKLWNTRFNHKLEELKITDCKRLFNQKGLEGCSAKSVTIRRYAHGASDTKELVIKDFSVFETMPNLESLNLFIKKKKDKSKDLISLSKLENIKEIYLPKNYFFFNQYAWLTSKLPNVKGIGCYRVEYDHANEMDGYIINGSRMCWYVRGFEKAKLKRYQKKFDELVQTYKNETIPPIN